jgi:hypothetical protein
MGRITNKSSSSRIKIEHQKGISNMANETKKAETVKVEIKRVDEIGGYVTVDTAAEIMGVAVNSVGGLIHNGKVEAVRFANCFAVLKTSAVAYKASRADKEKAEQEKVQAKALEVLKGMSKEQIEALLATK